MVSKREANRLYRITVISTHFSGILVLFSAFLGLFALSGGYVEPTIPFLIFEISSFCLGIGYFSVASWFNRLGVKWVSKEFFK